MYTRHFESRGCIPCLLEDAPAERSKTLQVQVPITQIFVRALQLDATTLETLSKGYECMQKIKFLVPEFMSHDVSYELVNFVISRNGCPKEF